MYNADFNAAAYEEIMLEAGLNRFIMSVKQWVSRTNSKGIVAKAGRYGGTYAYKDIAFEFASWVSPQSHQPPLQVGVCKRPPKGPLILARLKGGCRKLFYWLPLKSGSFTIFFS